MSAYGLLSSGKKMSSSYLAAQTLVMSPSLILELFDLTLGLVVEAKLEGLLSIEILYHGK